MEGAWAISTIYGTMSSKITLLGSFSSFQNFSFFVNSKVLLSIMALRILNWTIHHISTEFIHINASVTFLLLVLENLIKNHKGDFVRHALFHANMI